MELVARTNSDSWTMRLAGLILKLNFRRMGIFSNPQMRGADSRIILFSGRTPNNRFGLNNKDYGYCKKDFEEKEGFYQSNLQGQGYYIENQRGNRRGVFIG